MQANRSTAMIFGSIILIGCHSSPLDPVQTPQDTGVRCNASAVQKHVGKQASPALLAQARRESGAAIARILRPDDVVTLEYNDQRLTLATDEALEIRRVGCG